MNCQLGFYCVKYLGKNDNMSNSMVLIYLLNLKTSGCKRKIVCGLRLLEFAPEKNKPDAALEKIVTFKFND